MYLRFVRADIDESRLQDVRHFYQTELIPALDQEDGCLLAALLQCTSGTSEYVSMTLWESHTEAEVWEQSDRYAEILKKGAELLSSPSEWSEAFAESASPGTTAQTFTVEAGEGTVHAEDLASWKYLRITSFRVREGRWDDLVDLYDGLVVNTLLTMKGCLSAFLVEGLEDPDRGLSISIWEREEDAIRYELSGHFDSLTRKLKGTMAPTRQWQPAITSEGTSEGNPPTEGYKVIIGERI